MRLRYSYLIKCEEVVKDAEGNVTELRCTYDPMSGQGSSSDGRRVKGVIHWVSAKDAVEAEIRLFNPLFTKENPDDVEEGQTWEDNLNPESMVRARGLLLPRHRLDARTPRVQPHGDAQGFMGEDQQVKIG